jgi:hypothetical protein
MLERDGEVAYYVDPSGERLRVYDCAFGPPVCRPHHRRVMTLESTQANHRYFVPELGVPRVYRFAKGELHELTPERLDMQLRGAGFAARRGANVSALKPT